MTVLRRIREIIGLGPRLAGLEEILEEVRQGELATDDAAELIRDLEARSFFPFSSPSFLLLLCRVMGVVIALAGVAGACYSISFSFGTKEAHGTVIERRIGQPVVEYHVDGQRFTVRGSVVTSSSAYSVGKKVSVLYRPAEPRYAQIDSFTERWQPALALTIIGVFGVAFSFVLRRVFRVFTDAGF